MRSTNSNCLGTSPIILVLVAAAFASMACQINLGGPAPPAASIQVSTSEAEAFDDMWAGALEGAADREGELRLIVTEAQLTSFVARQLQQQEEPILTNPQVFLREGLIQVHGVADRGFVRANLLVTVEPVINEDGGLSFRVRSAEFGPLPVPDSLREGISSLISEAFAGSIGSLATGIRLEAVAIGNGELAISGRIR